VVEIPWFLTTYYGDTDVLRRSYGPMKRYVDYLATATKEWPFLDWWLGDWLEVGADGGRSTRTPIVQCSTMAYYHYAVQVARAARLLQRKADAERYERLAERIKAAYNARFLDPVTSRYALDSQSAQAMPLALGLAPTDRRAAILQRLVENVGERKGHISAGFVGYQYVLRALTACGRADLAYGMAATEEYPGWGHMVRGGGTTLWEAWNGNAFNFTSLGAVGAWMFEALGGIRPDPEQPGYRRIIVRPRAVDGLTWARASTRTPYGKVAVQWRKAGAAFALSVMIPCGSTAEVWVPARSATAVRESGQATARAPHVRYLRMEAGCAVYETGSGRYRFTTLSDRGSKAG
jgi:alpha-L-rhamnosidase